MHTAFIKYNTSMVTTTKAVFGQEHFKHTTIRIQLRWEVRHEKRRKRARICFAL